jgi:hypothetical protein
VRAEPKHWTDWLTPLAFKVFSSYCFFLSQNVHLHLKELTPWVTSYRCALSLHLQQLSPRPDPLTSLDLCYQIQGTGSRLPPPPPPPPPPAAAAAAASPSSFSDPVKKHSNVSMRGFVQCFQQLPPLGQVDVGL